MIQVYGGLVYMDFDQQYMQQYGHGQYTPLPTSLLPRLYLLYGDNPGDSGKVHSNVRQRWLSGDEQVHSLMLQVGHGKIRLEYYTLKRILRRLGRP